MDLHQAAKIIYLGLDCICLTLSVKLAGVNCELKTFVPGQAFCYCSDGI